MQQPVLLPLVLAAAAALAHLAGCGPKEPTPAPAPEVPEGTVLLVDQQPILASEVDRYVDAVRLIEPEFVLRDHRRKVLSNISIPIAAGAALDPASREEAFERAQRLLAASRETGQVPDDAPAPRVMTGTFKDVGLIPWAIATDLEPLTFSELHETPGAWTFFKLTATTHPPGEFVGHSQVTIVRYDVPYLPTEAVRGLVQSAIGGFDVQVVDPEWEPLVPPLYLYPQGDAR